MFQPKQNPKDLLVIQTARSKEAINHAAKEGFRPLVKPVIPSKDIHSMVMVYQDEVTGEIETCGDLRGRPQGKKEVIPPTFYYPYHFECPYAAYLLPPELAVGTKVWLDDVIEDIVAVYGNQGYHPRLKWSEATWNGADFDIHFDPEKDAPRLIG
jgi:hypothetical protein